MAITSPTTICQDSEEGGQSLESVTKVKRQAHPDTDAGSDDISAQLLPFVDPIMRPAAPSHFPCAYMRS